MEKCKFVLVSYSEMLKFIRDNNLRQNNDGWDERWVDKNGEILAYTYHGFDHDPCYIWKS